MPTFSVAPRNRDIVSVTNEESEAETREVFPVEEELSPEARALLPVQMKRVGANRIRHAEDRAASPENRKHVGANRNREAVRTDCEGADRIREGSTGNRKGVRRIRDPEQDPADPVVVNRAVEE